MRDMRSAPSTEQFVEVWQSSRNAGEVAKRLRMGLPAVYRRSGRLRAAGVKLKYFLPRIDVDALNAICEQSEGRK